MLLEDLNDALDIMEATRQAFPRNRWITELVEAAEEETLNRLI